MKALLTILIIIIVAAGGLFLYNDRKSTDVPAGTSSGAQGSAFGSGQDLLPPDTNDSGGTSSSTSGGIPTDSGGAAVNVRSFYVEAGSFYFKPKTLTVKEGDTVRLTVENVQGVHDLNIDEFNAGTKTLQSEEEDTITFVANKKGTFEYYCSIGNHRQMGMVGTLTVE